MRENDGNELCDVAYLLDSRPQLKLTSFAHIIADLPCLPLVLVCPCSLLHAGRCPLSVQLLGSIRSLLFVFV